VTASCAQATYFDSYTANADMRMKVETGQQHGRPTISGSVPGVCILRIVACFHGGICSKGLYAQQRPERWLLMRPANTAADCRGLSHACRLLGGRRTEVHTQA
jgi:hypothetical protein